MQARPMVELRPIKESTEDFEAIEKRIKKLFRDEIFFPLLKDLGIKRGTLTNSNADYPAVIESLQSGRITFYKGIFSGRFSSAITKELKALGAKWDRKSATFRIDSRSLPIDVRSAVSASDFQFQKKLDAIDKKLEQILPEEIAGKLKCSDVFDRTLWKTEKDFASSVKGITIAPTVTPEQRKRIADEWQNNMQLWIQDFTGKEIRELRTKMQESVFTGNRYGSAVKTIQESYGVTANKAKFLARQETSLLMTKYKQIRYQDAGVSEYRWGCVAGTAKHPVRPLHKKLEGKIYSWDNPPIVDENGNRKNPGQDYNCRCFAKPIVRFKT